MVLIFCFPGALTRNDLEQVTQRSRAGTNLALLLLAPSRGKAPRGRARIEVRFCPRRGNNPAPGRRVRSTRLLRSVQDLRLRSLRAMRTAIENVRAVHPALPPRPRSAPAAPAAAADAAEDWPARDIGGTHSSPHRH